MSGPDRANSDNRKRRDRPSHPPLAAALLMFGLVAFLVLVSFLGAR